MYYFKNKRMCKGFEDFIECIKYAFWNTCYLDDNTKIYGGERLIGFISHDGIKLRFYEISNQYDVEDFKNIEKRTVKYVGLPGLGETYEDANGSIQ